MSSTISANDAILLESGTNEVEFIEFFLGDVSYGINVSKVQRVLAVTSVKISQVAQAPDCVKGIIHIHDKPVMLMDLKQALNIQVDQEKFDPERQLILVTKFNSVTTAFLIDGISKIHRTSWELFEPMSDNVSHEGSAGFTTGTVTLNEKIIIILDLERLMLTFFPESHSHSVKDIRVMEKSGRENVKIVYAEDSKMVRKITVDILKKAGYENIVAFENGHEALLHINRISQELKAENRPLNSAIDLVLTDIEMPKMDGLTLCKRVKQDLSGGAGSPRVIVYSSLINKEMSAKCKSVMADAQLAKPEVEQIVELIDPLCIEDAPAS
ncbi:MAG: chemotaxis protein [Verrucomicrobiota bacterium]